MTLIVRDYIPSNLQDVSLYTEMADNIQFILGKGEIKLATSYENALAKISIDITSAGSGVHTIKNSLSNQTDIFTVDTSTDILTLVSFLDLEEGATVRLSNSGGVLPEGLAVDINYYVVVTRALARYIDIKNKYRDFLSLDNEIVRKIISEQGYDYISAILELMTLANAESKIFLGYLGIVHFLKGNRRGLELVFGLLNLDYTLIEWWEKSPQGTPDTFDLTVNIDLEQFTFDDVDSFDTEIQSFARQYVYPLLETFVIKATLSVQSKFYISAYALFGEKIVVLPPIITSVTTQSSVPYIGVALLSSEIITVQPA